LWRGVCRADGGIAWQEARCSLRQGDGLVIQRLCHLSRARLVPVLYPEGPAICRAYAEQATALKTPGTSIGANALWIACHALALEATLITHNLWEFERIDGLQLADWAAP